jgi:hypothetical protein
MALNRESLRDQLTDDPYYFSQRARAKSRASYDLKSDLDIFWEGDSQGLASSSWG